VEPGFPAQREKTHDLPDAIETSYAPEIAVTIPGGRMPPSTSGKDA